MLLVDGYERHDAGRDDDKLPCPTSRQQGCLRSLGREAHDTLRAEQLDVLAFLEAIVHEVESDDDDGVDDAGVQARDVERALHLVKLTVGPRHHLGGCGDEVSAALDGVVVEGRVHGGTPERQNAPRWAPERAAEGADPGAGHEVSSLDIDDVGALGPWRRLGREGLEDIDGVGLLGDGDGWAEVEGAVASPSEPWLRAKVAGLLM